MLLPDIISGYLDIINNRIEWNNNTVWTKNNI